MRSIVFTKKNKVELIDLPNPVAGPGKVVVEVHAGGVCHTDYEVLKDNYGTGAFPVVPGHEYAGVVISIGEGVNKVAVGDRVAVDPNRECSDCRACLRGDTHLCESLGAYGVTVNGGMAEQSVVSENNVDPIGDMSFQSAALAEPMGCVLNGLEAVHKPWMKDALIFGAGPMGLLMGLALKQAGMKSITFADISQERLDLARSFGFGAVVSGSEELEKWHHGADLAVEATGVAAVAAELTNYITNGGGGLYFGVCASDAKIEVPPFEIFHRQLTLAGSHSLNHNIGRALEVIEDLGDEVERLVSHQLPLNQVSDILSSTPPRDSLKVQWVRQ